LIDRAQFTPDGTNPPYPVPLSDICTVPTPEMAYLLSDLVLGKDGKEKDILEIGTGSGYQAAVLAERCRSVISIDVIAYPGTAARLPGNVALLCGNGYEVDTGELFDGVLVTFGASAVSRVWAKQLKDGGRLVAPVQCGQDYAVSVYERRGEELKLVDRVAYARFTPGVC